MTAEELNLISDKVLELEQENARLWQENEQLKRPQESAEVNNFLDLIAEDIEWQEAHLTDRSTDKMIEKVRAFRKIRPKKGEQANG